MSAKHSLLKSANRVGVSAVVRNSRWRAQRLLVLGYRGISQSDEHEWSDLYVTAEHVERRIALLQNVHANVLPLEDALSQLYSGTLPPKAVTFTFNDGAGEFASTIAPMLSAASMHATLYLSTYYARKQYPVFDPLLAYLLWRGRGRMVALPGASSIVSVPSSTRDPAFDQLYRKLRRFVVEANLSGDERNDHARKVSETLGIDFDEICDRRVLHLIDPAEVRALDPAVVSVQLHTHHHRTPTTLEDVQRELSLNAAEIFAMTGRKYRLKHFSYPSGRYSAQFVEWLTAYGIASATTSEPGYATRETPRLAIPRFIDNMSVSDDTFLAWVSGSASFAEFRQTGAGNIVSRDTAPEGVPAQNSGAFKAPTAAALGAKSKRRNRA